MAGHRPLQEICAAFSQLLAVSSDPDHAAQQQQQQSEVEEAETGGSEEPRSAESAAPRIRDVDAVSFAEASSRVAVLFRFLGIAFKFAEHDYVSKVNDLAGLSKNTTLQSIIELDMKDDCVKVGGSHSRNLLRVKRGLDMVRVLFEGLMDSECKSLRDSASRAYGQVFSPHHSYPIRAAVAAGMYTLPTKSQLLKKLNEDERSAIILMQEYVTVSDKLIKYVDDLFISKGLGIDW